MFKHILVPTDFSAPAEQALEVASDMANKLGARLSVVHVIQQMQPVPYNDGMMWPAPPLEASARKALDAWLAKARTRVPACEAILRPPGVISEEIIAVAVEQSADLIVMGTHGRRGVSRLVLGSTTERVVRAAPIPVLTVSAPGESAVVSPEAAARNELGAHH